MSVAVDIIQTKLDNMGKDWAWLAEKIGIDLSTMYRKKKVGLSTLTVKQIHAIVDALSLSKAEATNIFLW